MILLCFLVFRLCHVKTCQNYDTTVIGEIWEKLVKTLSEGALRPPRTADPLGGSRSAYITSCVKPSLSLSIGFINNQLMSISVNPYQSVSIRSWAIHAL